MGNKHNPRRDNGHRRTQLRNRVKARRDPCALCGQPIDYDLPARDPWSYELDEIIPVSKGGNPLDINNVQAVHRICNIRKGNNITPKNVNNGGNKGNRGEELEPLPWSRAW